MRRLLKHALELNKPVLILNIGPSRADGHPGIEKIEIASGLIMRDVVKAVMYYAFSSCFIHSHIDSDVLAVFVL
jgi:hypothetical protein